MSDISSLVAQLPGPEWLILYEAFGKQYSYTCQSYLRGVQITVNQFAWAMEPPAFKLGDYLFSAGKQNEALPSFNQD